MDFNNLNAPQGSHASTLDFGKAIDVENGSSLDFSKDNPGVSKIRIELYWESANDGDVAVVVADSAGKALKGLLPLELQDPIQMKSDKYQPTRGLVWYNNLQVPGISHTGDVLESNGDDTMPEEIIKVDLKSLQADAKELNIVASTFVENGPTVPFAELRNCKVLVINDLTNEVIYQYRLAREYRDFSSVELARFYEESGEWVFVSLGAGVGNSPQALSDIAKKYGL